MKHLRLIACVLAVLIGGSVGIAAADRGIIETTSATWTDQVQAGAAVKAGTWQVATENTCIAYGMGGEQLDECAIDSITFVGWGEPGKQVRNYYVNFDVDPGVVRRVSFDVDLSTATGQETSWSWKNAGVVAGGAQFTPRDAWTCAELPRVRGNGVDWQRPTIWLVVEENVTGSPRLCS